MNVFDLCVDCVWSDCVDDDDNLNLRGNKRGLYTLRSSYNFHPHPSSSSCLSMLNTEVGQIRTSSLRIHSITLILHQRVQKTLFLWQDSIFSSLAMKTRYLANTVKVYYHSKDCLCAADWRLWERKRLICILATMLAKFRDGLAPRSEELFLLRKWFHDSSMAEPRFPHWSRDTSRRRGAVLTEQGEGPL